MRVETLRTALEILRANFPALRPVAPEAMAAWLRALGPCPDEAVVEAAYRLCRSRRAPASVLGALLEALERMKVAPGVFSSRPGPAIGHAADVAFQRALEEWDRAVQEGECPATARERMLAAYGRELRAALAAHARHPPAALLP